MADTSVSRRRFLAASSAAVTAGLVSRTAAGANDRIGVGLIGTGDRCASHIAELGKLRDSHNVDMVAVCDVWKPNLESSAAKVEKLSTAKPFQTSRFGELLARGDVDAVVIATPDFAHTPIMIEALKAGKDVYVEKPMSLTVEEASEALDLARKNERIVQVGTQRRSEGRWEAARQLRESGQLGAITRVSTANCFNHARWARDFDDCKQEDVDWDAYLFNRDKVPFDPKLLRRWHFYKMCTNGLSGLWMAHLIDACHKAMDATYPTSAVALGGIYFWKDGREHSDNFHALLDYPEGFLFDWCMSLTNSLPTYYTIHGRYGTIDMEKSAWSGDGGDPAKPVVGGKLDTVPDVNHMANWLECMRSRQLPTADIQYGHQHAVATIMAAAALESGQRMRYDREKRKIHAG
jgi:predicted dehydrogenase